MKKRDTKPKDTRWLKSFIYSVVGGVIVLLGQGIIAPIVAREVKREESILEQKYKVCNDAIDIMQRYLASVKITGKSVPKGYIPPEKIRPTQVETNIAYALLTIYCKSNTIANEFYTTFGSPADKQNIDPTNIVKFVSAVRKELGVDKKGFTGEKFRYIIPRPMDKNIQKDKFN